MTTIELTLPVALVCSECDSELESNYVEQVAGGNYKLTPARITVKPCEKCLEKQWRAGMEAEREVHE